MRSNALILSQTYLDSACIHRTHGFDDQGRQYDASGQRHEWWDDKTVENFESRAKCISDQFGEYTLNGKPVSGNLTLGKPLDVMCRLSCLFRHSTLVQGPH
jgi:predicted metalloendopeptidase